MESTKASEQLSLSSATIIPDIGNILKNEGSFNDDRHLLNLPL